MFAPDFAEVSMSCKLTYVSHQFPIAWIQLSTLLSFHVTLFNPDATSFVVAKIVAPQSQLAINVRTQLCLTINNNNLF
jgi:hypothetical protein